MRNRSQSRIPGNGRPAVHFLMGLLLLAAAGSPRAQDAMAGSGDRFIGGEAINIEIPLDTASFLAGGYAIDSSGFVDLPVLGRLEIGGKSRGDVEEYLAQKLSNYIKDTHVRALPAIRLTLLGHFTHPGQYYLSPNTTVWEAVYRAGGIAGERTLDEIRVQRGEKTLSLSFLDEYSRGRTLAAAGLRSGDIVVMPVPRDNTGGWYWFTQGLTATAQIATIITSIITTYFIVTRVH